MILRPLSQRPTRRKRDRRGTEILEAAFTFLPLMWLTFGAIDFGYYFYVQHNVQGAAREGARAGVVPGGNTASVNAGVANVMNAVGLSGYSVTVLPDPGGIASPATFQVTVSMPYVSVGVPPARVPLSTVKGIMVMQKEGS